ncbi:MAG: VOC family protein [Pseudomonadota bacterium]|nr:VOC family protein [Pseudomonadota bacterium]MEC9300086.1 VOC family protein [Pseudomonadota bacterium]
MNIQKNAIDIGIIAKDIDAMLAFYRDALGLEFEAAIPMPGGGTMNRFKVGDSIIKVIELDPKAPLEAPPGGIRGASGYRYWTIHVDNLEECVATIESAGHKVVMPAKKIREGITIAIVEDPDTNWVELLENS